MRQSQVVQVSAEPQVRLSYVHVRAESPKGTILLIHGFPETGHQFRHVLGPLSAAGYDVLVPDYKGAGHSSKPAESFEQFRKAVIAKELHELVTRVCEPKEKIYVVGHDIGGMIAHTYASLFPTETRCVIWGECPLPGTEFYEQVKNSADMFHFTFQNVPDLPEALVTGREQMYLTHFYDRLAYNTQAHDEETIRHYVSAFSKAGALRCGFNLYRAFELDAVDNRTFLETNGKSKVPCLGLNGQHSVLATGMVSMLQELYEAHECRQVPESGHWIAEENPKEFTKIVLNFIRDR